LLKGLSKANITTGYTVRASADAPFTTYIEANVHAPKVFKVFRELCMALLPDIAAPLIGIKEEEPVLGPYTDRASAIATFEPYIDVLQNDGFLEFGMIHQSDFAFEEIFIASPKYFRIWTNDRVAAESVLNGAGLPFCETLEFIDNYPMVSVSIGNNDQAGWSAPYQAVTDEFSKLPPPT